MNFRMRPRRFQDKALFSSYASTVLQEKMRSGFVLALILIMSVFALPGSMAKLRAMKEMVAPGADKTGADEHELAKGLHWGRLVAASNPSLTKLEIYEIGRAILKYSGVHGLSPEVIVAIIKVESSGRVEAVSPQGAEGLMQVMPFWKDELGIEGTLFDIDTNIGAGTRILAGYIKEHGYREGLARYYRGSLPVDGEAYYGKVQKAMRI